MKLKIICCKSVKWWTHRQHADVRTYIFLFKEESRLSATVVETSKDTVKLTNECYAICKYKAVFCFSHQVK